MQQKIKIINMKTLLLAIGIFSSSFLSAFSAVYVIPPDYDEYRKKTDTVYDFTFRYLCSTSNGRLECVNLPSEVLNAQTPYSRIEGAGVVVRLRLRGNDRILLCQDYTNPSTCQEFQVDDYTSVRLEIVPYDQLSTYQIQKPNCFTGTPKALLPFYTPCSQTTQLNDNGNFWTLNLNCVPTNMNVPVIVFCDTWSK